ncbi:MAG TPA: RDD family protein [Acidimicrobiales bacterium]|nr:RDD family protein [Acidimicrobiales bacterium]
MSEYNTGGAAVAGGPSGPRASVGVRFVALIVDGIIVGVAQLVIALILGMTAARVIGTVLGLAYYIYFEGSATGQTLGKRVMGIRVVDFNTGGPIDMSRAVVRNLVRIVSGLACFLGYIWAFFNKEKQTWHDMAAQTVVVPVSAYPIS